MDFTAARWGLDGAEAIPKLRTQHTNGDVDNYRHYHLTEQRQRVQQTPYLNNTIPRAS